MRLIPRRLLAVGSTGERAVELSGPGVYDLGPLWIELEEGSDGFVSYGWSLANRGDASVRVRAVSLVFEVDSPTEPLRFFCHGYQSWSPTGVATFGIDTDPSTKADFEFLQAVHHADQRRARDDELRSEWVTLLADAAADLILAGFEAGHDHDGTWRLRRGERSKVELWAEAFLGDVALEPGERRSLHNIVIDDTEGNASAAEALTRWAREVGTRNRARVHAPYQVGWCSWYHYFHDITEAAFHDNLARARDWPFSVFQLDDGFQAAIGDWLDTNEKFPSGLPAIAEVVSAAGFVPGLWIAPFLAAPGSRVAREHPEWMAR
ncbi:MAG: alpha-galactosidase, partial [Acidimicrobiales bacterium]|nr:alpha-galactosidase [Acidimicrobiales bacterium]